MNDIQNHSTELTKTLQKLVNGHYIFTTKKSADEMTTRDKDYYAAGVVSWVTQTSFNPPQVMVALKKNSDLKETVSKSYVFALNLLGKKNTGMIEPFGKESSVKDGQINGFSFEEGKTGSPVFGDVPACLECRVSEIIDTKGDHHLVLGEVINCELRDDVEIMTEKDTEWRYGG